MYQNYIGQHFNCGIMVNKTVLIKLKKKIFFEIILNVFLNCGIFTSILNLTVIILFRLVHQ